MKLATSAVGSTGVEVSAALHVFVKRALYLFSSGAELELEIGATGGVWYRWSSTYAAHSSAVP